MTEVEIGGAVRDCLNNAGSADNQLEAAALFIASMIHQHGWRELDAWLVWERAANTIRQIDAVAPAHGISFAILRRRKPSYKQG